jgi:excisionase family DNA binding protein
MTADQQTFVEPLLLSVEETAKALGGVSVRTVHALNASGRLPLAVRLGRRTFFSADELRQFIAARNPKTGLLPTREQWLQILESRK